MLLFQGATTAPNIFIKFFLSTDARLSPDDVLLETPDRRIPPPSTEHDTLDLSGGELLIDAEKYPQLKFFCGKPYVIAKVGDIGHSPRVDPDHSQNQKPVRISLVCDGDVVAVERFHLQILPPESNVYTGVDLCFWINAVLWYFGSEDVPKRDDGLPHMYFRFFVSPNAQLDLDTDAPVQILELGGLEGDVGDRSHIHVLRANSKINLEGKVCLHLPFPACTSKDLLLEVRQGVHVTPQDRVTENNYRYVSLRDLFPYHCPLSYIDLDVRQFQLQPVASHVHSFKLQVFVNVSRTDPFGNGIEPLFNFRFYVSKNAILDKKDFEFPFSGNDQRAALLQILPSGEHNVTLDSMVELIQTPDKLPYEFCGSMHLLVHVVSSLPLIERLEVNNRHSHPINIPCVGGKRWSWVIETSGEMQCRVYLLKTSLTFLSCDYL